jgi:hypothetical protein
MAIYINLPWISSSMEVQWVWIFLLGIRGCIYIYVTGNLWIRVPDPGPDLCHCGGKEAPKSVADR